MKITVLDNVKDSFKQSERQKIINWCILKYFDLYFFHSDAVKIGSKRSFTRRKAFFQKDWHTLHVNRICLRAVDRWGWWDSKVERTSLTPTSMQKIHKWENLIWNNSY
jgi:hypothetical protein